ncbi:hypothetical protein NBRC10512v2_002332 [Rhodotorula toruloides]|uniref:non-specific serine/threonine protein kinase n=1 Tax=Rhodotorula toruloides (strain NP11) TaxID=1130832 RepID=M7WYU9_RHOT1|nr:protein serine/threonine kinase [Rhodotorula toruloides NP11]EMS25792.1 protein serine/threonine kinase [Rhodotorula toruloides NP11]
MSLRNSHSWLASLIETGLAPPSSADNKFSTVANGATGVRRSRASPSLFEEDAQARDAADQAVVDDELRGLQGLRESEAGWSVTPDPVLTVYVSTPTSSLTLSRKLSEIVDLEARLRAQFPDSLPERPPPPPPATPKKRSKVLASLTRTLSPRRNGPPSFSSFGGSRDSRAVAIDTKELGAMLTKASLDSTLRQHVAWQKFFAVRRDDLESARIERRIKRARSDQTLHLGGKDSLESPFVARTTLQTVEDRAEPNATVQPSTAPLGTEQPLASDVAVDVSMGSPADVASSSTPANVEMVLFDANEQGSAPSEPVAVSDSPEQSSVLEPDGESATGASVTPAAHAAPVRPATADAVRRDLAPLTSAGMTRSVSDVSTTTVEKRSKSMTIDAFEILRVLGKGCAGKVLLVRKKDTEDLFALKAITKRHVLAHRELEHTRTEQSVLKTCARDKSNPFVVRLHYSFHDEDTLYLALDFHPGADLASQLANWGCLGRDRARFYISEIIEGVEGLHRAGIIYRDLKPENVLIAADGHIVLTDFGLSKDFGHNQVIPSATDGLPRPHWLDHPSRKVLLGEPYSYECDIWSAGTMLYEMLAGVTPFMADNHATMYRRVLHDDLRFDERSRQFDPDTRALIRGMLQRDPVLRITIPRLKRMRYFNMISWDFIRLKRYAPPFVPKLNPDDPTDTSQFDDAFLQMPPEVRGTDPLHEPGNDRDEPKGEPQPAFDANGRDVFDGYSYYGRDSASLHRHRMEDSDEESEEEVEESPALDTEAEPTTPSAMDEDSMTPPAEAIAAAPPVQHEQEVSQGTSTSGDTMSDSVETDATSTTTAPSLSPELGRARQVSARSNLEPLPEHTVAKHSTAIVVEEDEEGSDAEWDMVETSVVASVRNGGREATLWQRGFRDRYRLVLQPLASPLRPPFSRQASRHNSRAGSIASSNSAMPISPATTPEPPSSPRPLGGMRRLASVRSTASGKGDGLRPQRSLDAGLYAISNGLKVAPPSPRIGGKTSKTSLAPSATSTEQENRTPRKGGSTIKKLTKSAFLSSNKA